MDASVYQKKWRKRFNERLDMLWQEPKIKALIQSERLLTAMQYSTTGGKRLRALFVYASNHLFASGSIKVDNYALAVELFHAFSLIHDDLPAIDDDALRRGQPSCHCAFDQATAIIAGDTLHALSYYALGTATVATPYAQRAHTYFTNATLSVMSGQMQDIYHQEHFKPDGVDEYEAMCLQKTAALFEASLVLGALSAETGQALDALPQLVQLGRTLGLAFQLQDDVLDIESTDEQLGKQTGSDEKNNKITLAAHSLSYTKKRVASLFAQAYDLLCGQGWQQSQLAAIIATVQHRDH